MIDWLKAMGVRLCERERAELTKETTEDAARRLLQEHAAQADVTSARLIAMRHDQTTLRHAVENGDVKLDWVDPASLIAQESEK